VAFSSMLKWETAPFSDVFARDEDRLAAFGTLFTIGNLVLDYCVSESLDEFFSAVGTVRILVFMTLNVSEVRVKNSSFLRHFIGFFQRFNFCGRVVEFVGWIIPGEV